MKIKLLSATKDYIEVINKVNNVNKLNSELTTQSSISLDEAEAILKKRLDNGDESLLEHIVVNLEIDDISLIGQTFLINHRFSSLARKDIKIDEYNSDVVYVPKFEFNSYVNDDIKENVKNEYLNLCEYLYNEYKFLIANGIPEIDARNVLPCSLKTKLVLTSNLREILYIISAATYGRGNNKKEIFELGDELFKVIKEIFPNIFADDKYINKYGDTKSQRLSDLFSEEKMEFEMHQKAKQDVELLSYTEDAETLIGITTLINNTNCTTDFARVKVNDTDFLKRLLNIVCTENRARELEMVKYTFRINNITLDTMYDLIRNRLSSSLVPSYADIKKGTSYEIPASIKENIDDKVLDRYNLAFEKMNNTYSEFKKLGISEESLIYLRLIGEYAVDIVMTMNARELYYFLKVRTCVKAKENVNRIACAILKTLREVSPFIFLNAGPECFVRGKCNKEVCCAEQEEVIKKFTVM